MRKDPTEFRKRFAAWKNGEQPYKDGKVVLNNYTNAKFNDDGTFTDDTTRVFDDFYVTPSGVKTKYGSYTDNNWDRYKQQESFFRTHDQQTGRIKYEPGLEIVSPEYDAVFLIKGVTNSILPKSAINKYAKFSNNQWDKAYNKALANGDIQKAQYLRDMHFRVKSLNNIAVDANGNPVKTYHTVGDQYNPNFTEFNPNIEGSNSAIYTSNDPLMSGTYSSKIVSKQEQDALAELMRLNELKNIESGYAGKGASVDLRKAILQDPERGRNWIVKNTWLNQNIDPARQKQLYVNLENPVVIDNMGNSWNDINISDLAYYYKNVWKKIRPQGLLSQGYSTRSLEAAQKAAGYDGAIVRNVVDYGGSRKSAILDWKKPSDVYMINNPSKLKSVNAITYDDAGNVIPLSKRDNFSVKDIRYAVAPLIFGAGVTNKYAE